MTKTPKKEAPSPREAELDEARELLSRAMKFLDQCQEDPGAAVEGEDPLALLEDLRGALETVRNDATPASPHAVPREEEGGENLDGSDDLGAVRETIRRRSA
jgi:hypothetical protein